MVPPPREFLGDGASAATTPAISSKPDSQSPAVMSLPPRSCALCRSDEPGADAGAVEAERDQHDRVVGRAEGQGIVVADHREQHRQREIGVVHRSAACRASPYTGSGARPSAFALTISR